MWLLVVKGWVVIMPEFSTLRLYITCLAPHSGDPEVGSALYWAVRDGHFDVAALLVQYGADVSRFIPSQVVYVTSFACVA